jgi:hypothetical protein
MRPYTYIRAQGCIIDGRDAAPAQPGEQSFPLGDICLDGRGGYYGNRSAGLEVFKKAFRIVGKISGCMVAGFNTGSAKNTLCWVRADFYTFIFILIRNVCRFNRTNTDAVVASDTFLFFQEYIGVFGGTHI